MGIQQMLKMLFGDDTVAPFGILMEKLSYSCRLKRYSGCKGKTY